MYLQVCIYLAMLVPEKGRGGFDNVGPDFNFPGAALAKWAIGIFLAIVILTGLVFFFAGIIGGVNKTRKGKDGAGKDWIGAVGGLVLIVLGTAGTQLVFNLSERIAPYIK